VKKGSFFFYSRDFFFFWTVYFLFYFIFLISIDPLIFCIFYFINYFPSSPCAGNFFALIHRQACANYFSCQSFYHADETKIQRLRSFRCSTIATSTGYRAFTETPIDDEPSECFIACESWSIATDSTQSMMLAHSST
jgi:hypothetical protein